MPEVEVAGRKLFYLRRGQGEPLLLMQGMSGNHAHWGEALLDALARDFELTIYDHRGMGHSAPIDGPFSIADLAEDAAGLLDELGIDSTHVLGLSMGGMVAQALALRHPERVRTLTLVGTSPSGPRGARTPDSTVQALTAAYMSGSTEKILRAGFEHNVSPGWAEDPGHYEEFLAMQGFARSPVEMLGPQLEAIRGHDVLDRLEQIGAPVLIVHGSADRILPVENARLIAQRLPDARLEILEDVGHVVGWERPDELAALVREHARTAATAQ